MNLMERSIVKSKEDKRCKTLAWCVSRAAFEGKRSKQGKGFNRKAFFQIHLREPPTLCIFVAFSLAQCVLTPLTVERFLEPS
jgi:hypothetical protein